MRSRGHPGYWLIFVLSAAGAAGLLYLVGVGEPLEKPWLLGPALAGVLGAEIMATRVLGWAGPEDDESGSGRTAALAIRGVPLALVVMVAALLAYAVTDAPAAAWTAFIALLVTVTLAFIAQMSVRA